MTLSNTKPSAIRNYFEITKPRILLMVLVTTAIGFVLANQHGHADWLRLLLTLLGTALSAAGAGSLNSCLEKDFDAKMDRTKMRPFPQNRISLIQGLIFGVGLTLSGVFVLQIFVNLLTAFLALLTVFLYVLVYTPLKKRSWLNTFVGAIPGALPILMGWSAARNELNLLAWILFLVLFAWQHPHFYAIAWMYKDDYKKAGFQMLPVIDETGRRTFFHVIFYAVLMLAFSLSPSFWHLTGWVYGFGALALGLMVLLASFVFVKKPTRHNAKRLLQATLIYFPGILGLVIFETFFMNAL